VTSLIEIEAYTHLRHPKSMFVTDQSDISQIQMAAARACPVWNVYDIVTTIDFLCKVGIAHY